MNSKNIFNELDIPIPDIVYSYDDKKQQELYNYLLQLINDEQQKKAYTIAFQHLASSFNIYKSNGFKEWKSKQK
jgi:ABC-type Fe2+-enterobactin transport system substrate-binding protein